MSPQTVTRMMPGFVVSASLGDAAVAAVYAPNDAYVRAHMDALFEEHPGAVIESKPAASYAIELGIPPTATLDALLEVLP